MTRGKKKSFGTSFKTWLGSGISFINSKKAANAFVDDKVFASKIIEKRTRRITGLFVIVAIVIFAALFYIQVINAQSYIQAGENARTESGEIAAHRGTIYDRNGNVLAISVDVVTVVADPSVIVDPYTTAEKLAGVLGGEKDEYYEKVTCDDTRFVYIAKQISTSLADKVKALQLDGIYYFEDVKREYPYGEVGGQIIGLCNADGEGVCGLELYYDDILSGTPGKRTAQTWLDGIAIEGETEEYVAPIDGKDIMISLDIALQAELEQSLKDSAEQKNATSTNGIIMDASTGEIYAMASLPLFDLGNLDEIKNEASYLKGVVIASEPGSVFKTVTALSLLENDAMELDDYVNCPAQITVDEYAVSDSDGRTETKDMTLRDIIAVSSNVGTSLAVERYMDFETLYQSILDCGILDSTGIDYPGESEGVLSSCDTWSKIKSYNVTFGQGVSVTPIQVASFYGILANGGIRVTPHFCLFNLTDGIENTVSSTQVISDEALIEEMNELLRGVIMEGTGWEANIEGYTVVGKTGTAEIASSEGGYIKDLYNRTFVGYLCNASMPLVVYYSAENVAFEGTIASTFKDIMTAAIERLNVVSR